MTNALDIGFRTNPSFDNTLAWNSAVSLGADIHTIYFPPGTYNFYTKPHPVRKTISIVGESLSTSLLVKLYVDDETSFINFTAGCGSRVENIGIIARSTNGGTGLRIAAQDTESAADFTTLNNILITSTDNHTWKYPIKFDGFARHGMELSGIRDICATNLVLFNAREAAIYINTVHSLQISVQPYVGAGKTDLILMKALKSDMNSNISIMSPMDLNLNIMSSRDVQIVCPKVSNLKQKNSTVRLISKLTFRQWIMNVFGF